MFCRLTYSLNSTLYHNTLSSFKTLCSFNFSRHAFRVANSQNRYSILVTKTKSPYFIFNNGFHTRSFKRTRIKDINSSAKPEKHISRSFHFLIRPLGFTVLVSSSSFVAATVLQYENIRHRAHELYNNRHFEANKFYNKAGDFRQKIHQWWNQFNKGQKMCLSIIGLNCAVFGLWRISRFRSIMSLFFTSTPFSKAPCSSMVLSTFSHHSFLHLAANMYVFWSFSSAMLQLLGTEQTLAFYMSAGVISSFCSYAFKVASLSTVPSLGASGAIMAFLSAVCWHAPDTRLSIAFIGEIFPHSFSASSGLKAILLFDTLGLIFRWNLFDHAAHLGGALFGIWYITYGNQLIWANREPILKAWHKIRGND